jgi:hypothetical protein
MRICCIILFIIAFSLVPFGISAENIGHGGPINTVEEFLIASSEGDVEAIKELIGGAYYERRRALLNSNQEYPKLLRSHFERGHMRILEVQQETVGNIAIVTVGNQVKEGQITKTKLVLNKNQSGEWKIVDEIFE